MAGAAFLCIAPLLNLPIPPIPPFPPFTKREGKGVSLIPVSYTKKTPHSATEQINPFSPPSRFVKGGRGNRKGCVGLRKETNLTFLKKAIKKRHKSEFLVFASYGACQTPPLHIPRHNGRGGILHSRLRVNALALYSSVELLHVRFVVVHNCVNVRNGLPRTAEPTAARFLRRPDTPVKGLIPL